MVLQSQIIETVQSVKECVACPLVQQTTNGPVPGVGNVTGIVGVGRNPGADEDQNSGQPFSGASGRMLDSLFFPAAGLTREDIFLTNLTLCYTIKNEEPPLEHVKTCTSLHLYPHLSILRPYLVLAFGGQAAYVLTGQTGISNFHGSIFKNKRGFYVIPCYHPGAALRNPKLRSDVVYDAAQVRRFLAHREHYQRELGW